MIENINWYPGHMKKTRELIAENLKLVDLVIELLDARIPAASRNPVIGDLTGSKSRLTVLNKADLADAGETIEWQKKLAENGDFVISLNSNAGDGVKQLLKVLERIQEDKNKDRERKKNLRMMIAGIPNVGKSSLINRLTGSRSAKTGDKPGVTRGKQWLSLTNGMMLLDTPGILWPKFEDKNVALDLAFCGSIKDEIMDVSDLGLELIARLSIVAPDLLCARYKLDGIKETPLLTMEAIAAKRGFIMSGKRIDYERTAKTVLDEFRSGAIGRITLEKA
ncbi:MAG: ribosome biogenesis GTPase YlqF [Clostridia bacterium]|nr:ribosome biogenesis GTPase YlqF [Clostridia bacterium]